MDEKIEKQVQKRLAELQASEVSVASENPEPKQPEEKEEVVEVLEKTEAEEQLLIIMLRSQKASQHFVKSSKTLL